MKQFVKRLLGITRIDGRIDEVAHRFRELTDRDYAPARGCWHRVHDDFYEPQVNLALRDLCRPGTVVFDCGANIGMLSLLMSRLVGPRGVVCAFEASPRNRDMCQNDLIANHCTNVTLYHRALCDRTGQRMPLYYRDDLQADGIVGAPNEKPSAEVLSLALDEFVAHSGLIPDVVKFDIEGAEFDALKGFAKTLSQHRPHLIVETRTDDQRVLELLRARGYRAIELNTYREIVTAADYPAGSVLRSVLFIHNDRLSGSPYAPPIASDLRCTLGVCDFANAGAGTESKQPIALEAGRYVIEVNVTVVRDEPVECGARAGDRSLAQFRASAGWICSSYREWVIDLAQPTPVTLYATPAGPIRFDGVSIRRIVPLSKPGPWRAIV